VDRMLQVLGHGKAQLQSSFLPRRRTKGKIYGWMGSPKCIREHTRRRGFDSWIPLSRFPLPSLSPFKNTKAPCSRLETGHLL
jgi:hypothetical protein